MVKKKRAPRSNRAEAKRELRKKQAIGVFIIAVMLLSSLAFIFVYYAPNNVGAADVGNYEIRDNQIIMEFDNKEVYFYSFPDENIYVPPQATSLLQGASTVITVFDPQDQQNLQYVELVRWELSQFITAQQGAGLSQESDQYAYPVLGCEVATPITPVLQFVNGSDGISVNESCITVSGEEQYLLLLRDQLLYSYYGARS